MERRFVVVSGLPGSGKSTIGRRIAPGLVLDLIDKDDQLESLFGASSEIDDATRSRLSREADTMMFHQALASPGAVLIPFWRRPAVSTTSGTPTEWLNSLPNTTELYCECPVETAVQRFSRRQRHAGHRDAVRTPGDLHRQFEAIAALGPLGVGRLVTINTEHEIDTATLVAEILAE